ncbi:hypothetical protein DIPPA_31382 [Diplonema papillatum]|nr:hypothetical protein DIPPA_31382 [Diplonema papillatum]
MSNTETIKKIGGLAFPDGKAKAAVLATAAKQDFGALVDALADSDPAALADALQAAVKQADGTGDARSRMVLDSIEREETLQRAARRRAGEGASAEPEEEPCRLTPDERAALLEQHKPTIYKALEESQAAIMKLGMKRDELEEGSAEDRALEEQMALLFEKADNARRLASMWESYGKDYTDEFWRALTAQEDPLTNNTLLKLSNVWIEEDEEGDQPAVGDQ